MVILTIIVDMFENKLSHMNYCKFDGFITKYRCMSE